MTDSSTLKIDPSKAPKDDGSSPHVEHWCMAQGCSSWGDFGFMPASGKGALSQLWFCSTHRAQYLQLRDRAREQAKAKDAAERPVLVENPEQGGLF
ncbi:hypothetical protein [Cohaesibacter celericrescens]|uniref:hypothetical protein n=1 Tax=Cohaesibacter celericrescens TaxID=2067669 RepID=UPI0015E112EE|nr:hypothetical protein [Cohaesibacter celericrescens]